MSQPPELPLQGLVVLLTGAGRWPGPAVARAFAQAGATVVINDLSPVPLDAVIAASPPGRVHSYVADATRGMPLRAMIDEVLEQFGRLDVLINNPRICPAVPLMEMDEWEWHRTMEMNVNGPFMAMQLAAKAMGSAGGVIINIVDPPGAEAADPELRAGRSAYRASQSALRSLSEDAAREFLAYNIRVFTLCPEPSEDTEGLGEQLAAFAQTLCGPAARPMPGQTFSIGRP